MLQLAILALVAASALANPAPELEARAAPACKTRQAGILSARYFAPFINFRAFTLSNDGQIAYKVGQIYPDDAPTRELKLAFLCLRATGRSLSL